MDQHHSKCAGATGKIVAIPLLSAAALALLCSDPAAAATADRASATAAAGPLPDYAPIAALAEPSPTIAVARIRAVASVRDERAVGLRPGFKRYYLEADTVSLIRGDAGIARRFGFVIDLPEPGSKARASRMKRSNFVLFGDAAAGGSQFQLLDNESLLPWTPEIDVRVRAIVSELVAPDAPPALEGVMEAFHVPGTVAGESETQIFLAARGGRPVSLSVVRRPGQAPHFGAALGEIIDEAAGIPPRDTLLWYRLACQLPAALPGSATAALPPGDATAAAADYRAFREALGPCR